MLFTATSDLFISYILSIKQLMLKCCPIVPSGGEFAQARLRKEAYACRGLDHLVKLGVQEVQRPVKSALFEVAFPHEEGETLGCLPSVLIELVGASERINPALGLCEGGDLRVVLKRCGVQWNGHGSLF